MEDSTPGAMAGPPASGLISRRVSAPTTRLDIGALGHGDQKTHYVPKQVAWFEERNIKIAKIAGGVNLSVALDTEGKVYCWGKGNYGLLGDGHNTHALEPVLN